MLMALMAILAFRHKIVSDRERTVEKLTGDGISLLYAWQKPSLSTVMVYDNAHINGSWVDVSAQITKLILVPSAPPTPTNNNLAWILGPAALEPHTIRMPISSVDAEMFDILEQLPELQNLLLHNRTNSISFDKQLKRLEEIRMRLAETKVKMESLPREFAE